MKTEDYLHPSDKEHFSALKEEETLLTSHQLINLRSRQFPGGHDIHLHYHDTLEIDMSMHTTGTIMLDGTAFPIKNGSIFVIPPGILHSYHFEPGSRDFTVLHISLETLATYMYKEKLFGVFDSGLQDIPWFHESYTAIGSIINDLYNLEETDTLAILSAILAICSILMKPTTKRPHYQDPNEQMKRAIEFTEKSFQQPISVADAASAAGLSRSFFSRKFKAYTGTSYSTYLTQVRVSHAKHLLLQGANVTESCLDSGFENLSYFIETFKRYNQGISPGKFQKLYKTS